MSETARRGLRELQREYLAELPTAIADLRQNIEALRRGEDVVAEPAPVPSARRLGWLLRLSRDQRVARAAEQSVASSPPAAGSDRLDEAVRRLEAALTVARAQ